MRASTSPSPKGEEGAVPLKVEDGEYKCSVESRVGETGPAITVRNQLTCNLTKPGECN
jgi:hypothetical protein